MARREIRIASQNRCYVNFAMSNSGNSGTPWSGNPDMAILRHLAIASLLASVPAFADEPKPDAGPQKPARVIEVPPWEPPARATTKTPGIRGQDSSGIVIDPGAHADARPYPYGAWIKTPDIGDRNVLELGTNGLPDRPSSALSARLARGLDRGVEKLFELLLPPPKLVR
jgi:hypothetical protein